MRLYLVRHGEAAPAHDDFLRELTPAGRADVVRLAGECARAGLRVDRVRHSGLVRARQTAEILAARLSPSLGVAEMSGIGPDGDAETAGLEIGLHGSPLLVVTHMPFVARLEGWLLTGLRGTVAAPYATAELRGFKRTDDHWIRFGAPPQRP